MHRFVIRAILTVTLVVGMSHAARASAASSLSGGLLPSGPAAAPSSGPAADSPRAAMALLIDASAKHREDGDQASLQRAIQAMELGDFGRTLLGESRSRLVRELSEIFDRLDATSELEQLPDAARSKDLSSYQLTLSRGPENVTFQLVKGSDNSWRLSDASLREVEAVHARVVGGEDLTTQTFRSLGLHGLTSRTAMGLKYSTWIGLFIILVLGAFVDMAIRLLTINVGRRYLLSHGADPTQPQHADLIRRTARPFGLAAGGGVVFALVPLLGLPLKAEGVLLAASKAFFLFALVWSAYRVVDLAATRVARKYIGGDDGGIRLLLIPLVTKAVKLFILALGLVFIAESFNLPITSLLAGIGIGGIALAVAAKGTLENVFGTIGVVMDRPFRVGDWVIINDIEGTVEEFSFRSTRIRTRRDSVVTMPNSLLVAAAVDNLGMRNWRMFRTTLSILYSTPPDLIEEFCRGVRGVIEKHPSTRKDGFQVELHEFGASSLDILLNVYFAVPDWPAELHARHTLMVDILRLADGLGVDFAFPTRTLHVAGSVALAATPPTDPGAVAPAV